MHTLDEMMQQLPGVWRAKQAQRKGPGRVYSVQSERRGAVQANGRRASEPATRSELARDLLSNLPMTVHDAARFLGVSPQTVYLWVERKQIPHFRVMGRNIRFLKSDLKPFRDQFKQEVENGTTA